MFGRFADLGLSIDRVVRLGLGRLGHVGRAVFRNRKRLDVRSVACAILGLMALGLVGLGVRWRLRRVIGPSILRKTLPVLTTGALLGAVLGDFGRFGSGSRSGDLMLLIPGRPVARLARHDIG